MQSLKSSILGFPRIGAERELKKAVERHWSQQSSEAEVLEVAKQLRERHWKLMHAAGIDVVPSSDFSLYDQVLDTAVMVGAVPERYAKLPTRLARYFAMARGHQRDGFDLRALEMTKWFDTNYHSLVPELEARQTFKLDASDVLAHYEEAKKLGVTTRPVIVGPVTFLKSSKRVDDVEGAEAPSGHRRFRHEVHRPSLVGLVGGGSTVRSMCPASLRRAFFRTNSPSSRYRRYTRW